MPLLFYASKSQTVMSVKNVDSVLCFLDVFKFYKLKKVFLQNKKSHNTKGIKKTKEKKNTHTQLARFLHILRPLHKLFGYCIIFFQLRDSIKVKCNFPCSSKKLGLESLSKPFKHLQKCLIAQAF